MSIFFLSEEDPICLPCIVSLRAGTTIVPPIFHKPELEGYLYKEFYAKSEIQTRIYEGQVSNLDHLATEGPHTKDEDPMLSISLCANLSTLFMKNTRHFQTRKLLSPGSGLG
jgi:hypothetical protein